jgi:TP901 family phage tail tape measure protein
MAFNAGAIVGKAKLDDSQWSQGTKKLVKGIGVFAASVGVVAVGAMTKATKSANEWQKSLSNVSTLTDEAITSNQEMAKSLLLLDPKLGETAELTDAMYQSFSSGAEDMDEALRVTTDAAKFAKAAITDTSTSVDVLTTATNAYGKDVVDTTKASDIFFTTIKQGKINGEELSSTIGKSIPLFASLNVPLEELGAGMAAMTKQGVSAAESTTQLNGIMNAFLKPSADMSAALEAQGFASGSALLETEGLSGALEFLETASGGSKDELSKLLPSVEAVRGTLALTGTGGKEFTKILGEMENAAGATEEAFNKQELTFDTLENAMGKVELVAGNIGKFFVDDIAAGATQAASSVLTFLMSSEGMDIVANTIGGVAATFDLLKSIISPIINTLLPIGQEVFAEIDSILQDTGASAGDGSVAFDILGTVIQSVTATLRVMGVSVVGFIDNLGNMIVAIQASGRTIGTFFDFLKGKASWDEVKEQAASAGEAFKDLAVGVKDNFADLALTIVEEVSSFTTEAESGAREIETSFKASFTNTTNSVKANWDEMITGQADFTGEMLAGNLALVEGIIEGNEEVEEDTEDMFDSLLTSTKEYVREMEFSWEGLYASIGSVTKFGIDSLQALTNQGYTNDKAALENWKAEELAILEDSLAKGLLSEEEFQDKKDALDSATLQKQNELARKNFEIQKKFNIAKVWMDSAGAISGWWSIAPALGPIAGPIFAGTMSGLTIAMAIEQTKLINQQEFVPARREGGLAGGLTRVNEAGGEIITLPDGSQVIPNDISRQIAKGSQAMGGNVFKFYNTTIAKDMDIDRLVNTISRKLSKKMRGRG